MFTSKELNTFICVSERKSIKLAAEELHISSPAVCAMIKKLEGRVNNKLFIFKNNRMALTKYGERIYSLTRSHFYALRSLEGKIKENKKIIKIFIGENMSFLSSFMMNKFKKNSIEIMLTNIMDDSVDVIIDDSTSIISSNYIATSFVLNLYLVHDKETKIKDIFIHTDYSNLITKYLTPDIKHEIENRVDGEFKVVFSNNLTSIVEMLLFSLGFTILPHLCPLLQCLEKSELEIKKLEKSIPLLAYTHKRLSHELIDIIESMFQDITNH